jgi:hypothetical protein
MVKYSNRRTGALPESAGPESCRPAVSRRRPPSHPARKPDEDLVVCVPLCEGHFELHVPKGRVNARDPRRRIDGFNADATPC